MMPAVPFKPADDGARDLHLLVGAEAKPHDLILRRQRHRAAPDKNAVAVDRDPAGQERRVFRMLETRLQEGGLVERRAPRARSARAQDSSLAIRKLFAPFAGGNADPSGNAEHAPGSRRLRARPRCSSASIWISRAPRPNRRFAGCSSPRRRLAGRRRQRPAGVAAAADSARSGAAAPARCRPCAVRTVDTASATSVQSSPVFCTISARRTSSSAGLRSLRAGIEPRVVERRPARAAHRIGDAQLRRRPALGRIQVDPDFQLARRIGAALGLQPRESRGRCRAA